jgi:voltage-gated potassium channel
MSLLLFVGTQGYFFIGQGKWSLFDCFYMTVITVTTVGFSETLNVAGQWGGRGFTVFLLFMSLAINSYFISTITAFFLSEEFEDLWWRSRMQRSVKRLKDHVIVCGGGETGKHVIKELLTSGWQVVLVDSRPEIIRELQESFGWFPAVDGDATEERILEKAGIDRAYGVIVVLPNDKDNLFLTVTARRMNPKLRIISKGINFSTLEKLERAGADGVVSPNYIGGIRIAAQLVRPHVVQFLDLLTRQNDLNLSIEEVNLPSNSPYCNKLLRDTDLREKELLVLAVRSPKSGQWQYNPASDFMIDPASTIIVLGNTEAVESFRDEYNKVSSNVY